MAAHEREHLTRIGRELQLEQFLPHFLLRTAQDRDVAGKAERARHDVGPEAQHLVDAVQNSLTLAQDTLPR